MVGADRIARNGDTANKIGTYQIAITCKHHNVPFYIAAPTATIDLDTASGIKYIPTLRIYMNEENLSLELFPSSTLVN